MEPVASLITDPEDSRADTLVTPASPAGEPPLTARVVRGAAWVFVGKIVGRAMQFVNLIILARLLTPEDFGLPRKLENADSVLSMQPLAYLDFLKLSSNARLILTDSGGLQEEACVLNVPCPTLRENTERPATIAAGWNRLIGSDRDAILAASNAALARRCNARCPSLWDGRASGRIVDILAGRRLADRTES